LPGICFAFARHLHQLYQALASASLLPGLYLFFADQFAGFVPGHGLYDKSEQTKFVSCPTKVIQASVHGNKLKMNIIFRKLIVQIFKANYV
jgi:hypothetical protein